DAQAVPLEDYLEIRPENKPIIAKYIKEGRINAGPWYSALDMNCISGESILRNMLYGHRLVEDFGDVMKVGYTPFGWGQCSQFPQIYRGFDIDVCFFYRGITKEQAPGAEFAWEGVDGSKVLCSRFGTGARYNFYFGVWREALYEGLEHRLYRRMHWFEDAAPFKLCNSENRFSHGYVMPEKRKMNGELARKVYRKLIEEEKEHFTTEHIACMHGMDTSTPDLREKELLDLCQHDLEEDETFFLSSMPKYAEAIKSACPNLDELPTLNSEPRHVKMGDHGFSYIANDIISARSRQKIMLFDAENQLSRVAEPFAALARIHGRSFPQPFIDVAWKQLLKCHPHDTVGGCGIDRLEEDATYRMKDAMSVAQMVASESLLSLQQQIDTSAFSENAVILTVYNPSTSSRTETVEAFVDIPREFIKDFGPGEGIEKIDWSGFKLVDDEENAVAHSAIQTEFKNKVFRDHADLALMSYADEFKLKFVAENVPALGYKTFALTVDDGNEGSPAVDTSAFKMENDHLVATVNENGTIDLFDKASGQQFEGLNYFQDDGEVGHPWTHLNPGKDLIINSLESKAKRQWVETTAISQSITVELELLVPETTPRSEDRFEWQKTERKAENLKSLKIEVTYTLQATAKSLDVSVHFDNQCKNHRLRAMFPTKVEDDYSFAESPFDVVKRRILKDDKNPYNYAPYLTYPMLRFSGIAGGTRSFALISGGLKEYEVLEDDTRTYALTLL
ncbi:MAG: glycoside hydrolase family 38 C-terminal domain-containing protein, partial [Verrucomicrobiota bacterium]